MPMRIVTWNLDVLGIDRRAENGPPSDHDGVRLELDLPR
jgi:hypothetical protein